MVRNVEQRPVLFALVRELLGHEKLLEFADSLPTRARVSEPALPLVVSALHEQLDRALTILVPEDADARDLAEAATWYLGPERVALLPSRGVRWDSGLRPPPHLVGERARALHLLEQGALVVVSASAASEGLPPEDADARDLAEAAAWYLGPERVALLPSRGVRWDSGLQPPPHLVGERARALDVLDRGWLVVVSAAALAEGMPHERVRPAPIRVVQGEQQGIEQLTEALALAGYERVERA